MADILNLSFGCGNTLLASQLNQIVNAINRIYNTQKGIYIDGSTQSIKLADNSNSITKSELLTFLGINGNNENYIPITGSDDISGWLTPSSNDGCGLGTSSKYWSNVNASETNTKEIKFYAGNAGITIQGNEVIAPLGLIGNPLKASINYEEPKGTSLKETVLVYDDKILASRDWIKKGFDTLSIYFVHYDEDSGKYINCGTITADVKTDANDNKIPFIEIWSEEDIDTSVSQPIYFTNWDTLKGKPSGIKFGDNLYGAGDVLTVYDGKIYINDTLYGGGTQGATSNILGLSENITTDSSGTTHEIYIDTDQGQLGTETVSIFIPANGTTSTDINAVHYNSSGNVVLPGSDSHIQPGNLTTGDILLLKSNTSVGSIIGDNNNMLTINNPRGGGVKIKGIGSTDYVQIGGASESTATTDRIVLVNNNRRTTLKNSTNLNTPGLYIVTELYVNSQWTQDGAGTAKVFVNGQEIGSGSVTNLPPTTGRSAGDYLVLKNDNGTLKAGWTSVTPGSGLTGIKYQTTGSATEITPSSGYVTLKAGNNISFNPSNSILEISATGGVEVTSLSGLSDVNSYTSSDQGKYLRVNSNGNGTEWSNISLSDLSNTEIGGSGNALSNGLVLVYDSSLSNWKNTSLPANLPSGGINGDHLIMGSNGPEWETSYNIYLVENGNKTLNGTITPHSTSNGGGIFIGTNKSGNIYSSLANPIILSPGTGGVQIANSGTGNNYALSTIKTSNDGNLILKSSVDTIIDTELGNQYIYLNGSRIYLSTDTSTNGHYLSLNNNNLLCYDGNIIGSGGGLTAATAGGLNIVATGTTTAAIPVADNNHYGVIKIDSDASLGTNQYPVELSSGVAYVEVPATSLTSVTWNNVTGKPSWIGSSKPSYTASEVDALPSSTTWGLSISGNNLSISKGSGSTLVTLPTGGGVDNTLLNTLITKINSSYNSGMIIGTTLSNSLIDSITNIITQPTFKDTGKYYILKGTFNVTTQGGIKLFVNPLFRIDDYSNTLQLVVNDISNPSYIYCAPVFNTNSLSDSYRLDSINDPKDPPYKLSTYIISLLDEKYNIKSFTNRGSTYPADYLYSPGSSLPTIDSIKYYIEPNYTSSTAIAITS